MRVYIAGPISDANPIKLLRNIAKGLWVSAYLVARGYNVFSPFLDFQLFLGPYAGDITKERIQANSMSFVEVCDVMLVLCGHEKSSGTKKEIARATECNLPVYYDRDKFEKEMKP